MPSIRRRLLAGLALTAMLTGPALAADALQVMRADPRFKTWVKLINAAGLEGYPQGAATFTVFVPVDASMQNLPENALEQVMPRALDRGIDTSQTVYVVRSHVLPGLHPPKEFAKGTVTQTSINGFPIVIDAAKPDHVTVKFQSSSGYISGPPLFASNAVIYPVMLTDAHFERH